MFHPPQRALDQSARYRAASGGGATVEGLSVLRCQTRDTSRSAGSPAIQHAPPCPHTGECGREAARERGDH